MLLGGVDSVRVNTREAYSVHIGHGLLASCMQVLGHDLSLGRALVVTNPVVRDLWLGSLVSGLKSIGTQAECAIIDDGEHAKQLSTVSRLYDMLAQSGHDRDTVIFALGGGVVGDTAGFAAATYMRGIRYVQVPTTLLSQVDASVGGKVAVNHAHGKNLIGAFHQPSAVLCDVSTLMTLPWHVYADGLAEVIKTALIDGEQLLSLLEEHSQAIVGRDPEILARVVGRCVRVKAAIVSEDERDTAKRMILNLGHTFGHALEAAYGYAQVSHGRAVAVGMVMASRLAEEAGIAERGLEHRLSTLLGLFQLPRSVRGLGVCPGTHAIARHLMSDKKRKAGRLRLVLPCAPGDVRLFDDIPDDAVLRLIQQETHAAVGV